MAIRSFQLAKVPLDLLVRRLRKEPADALTRAELVSRGHAVEAREIIISTIDEQLMERMGATALYKKAEAISLEVGVTTL